MDTYDVIIIGGGQAGTPLAAAFATAGKKTAVIEEKHMGGTCINEGCTPTKTMVASAEAAYMARRGDVFGVQDGKVSVDLRKVRQRKDSVVESFRGSNERRVKNAGADLIEGHASFAGSKVLDVRLNHGGVRQITAPTILINAGARSRGVKLDGLERVSFLDSTSIMDLESIPEHLLILGGGYIAVEFGQMFRRFGSRVTIVQQSGQLLGREDPDVAEAVLKILQEDGVEVLLNSNAFRVDADTTGAVHLKVRTPQGEQTLAGSHLLLAIGRIPNSDRLNLAAAGVETDELGNIRTNERLETNVAGIYALGDIKGGPAFTHISYDDYRILKTNLLDGGRASIRGRMVPYTVFIDPQLGRIGLTEADARKQFRNVGVASMPMNYVARAIETEQTRGFMKAIVDLDTKQILGASILGFDGGEIMTMIEIAMMGKLTYPTLRDAIFAHPLLAESLNTLFASLP